MQAVQQCIFFHASGIPILDIAMQPVKYLCRIGDDIPVSYYKQVRAWLEDRSQRRRVYRPVPAPPRSQASAAAWNIV